MLVVARTGGCEGHGLIKLPPPSAREDAGIFSRESIPGGWREHGKAVEEELEGAQRSGAKAV